MPRSYAGRLAPTVFRATLVIRRACHAAQDHALRGVLVGRRCRGAAALLALVPLAVALAGVVGAILALAAADTALVPFVALLHVRLDPVRRLRDPALDLLGQLVRLVLRRDRDEHALGFVLRGHLGALGHVDRAQPQAAAVRPLLVVTCAGYGRGLLLGEQ